MTKKTIGIIGGMGPLATCDLMEKIISLTDAGTDQDNIHLVVDCNTDIPDRTAAILGAGESPVPQLVRSGIKLQGMGAEILLMPCNTAHYFYDSIVPYFDVPLLHMIKETADELNSRDIKKVGLLATSGTIQSDVYTKTMERENIGVLIPSGEGQNEVMELIYQGVKAGKKSFDTSKFCRVMEDLLGRGAQALLLGCTELPVAMEWYGFKYPVIDPTEVLAKAAVRYCSVIRKAGE